MEFGCSICEYISSKKGNVTRHIKIKKGCENAEIVEIPAEIKCEYCDKNFANEHNLRYHLKNNCKMKDAAKDAKIKELEEQLKQSKQVTNNITNNNNNTTNNFIIVVNNYEDTNLDKITDKTYNKLLRDSEAAYQIIPRLIKQIHFDPKTPENHNLVISNRNKNNKHLQIFRNGHWEIADKNTEIDNLISDKETNLSDWVTEKGQKYPEAMEKFNEYLDQKYDEDVAKLMKDEVEMLLYNSRHMVKPA
jgi:anion-transporting  ArsA/GET3 family ATPase